MLTLSICISTFRRADFLGQTLDSIISQLRPGVELVVVDGASPDHTPQLMAKYLSSHPQIRYYREADNSGVDGDYDKAVGYARGKYCWLMTDDDLLRSDAIEKVLSALESNIDLVVVNAEIRNADLSEILENRRLNVAEDLEFRVGQEEEFFSLSAIYLSFIGCVVVKRELWLSRERSKYYGTLFIHMGVIFQNPPIAGVKVISDPLIIIRYGNAMWTGRSFEIWGFKWPQLIWSFTHFSEHARQAISAEEPWRRLPWLLRFRATGAYSITEYRRHLASRLGRSRWTMAFWAAVLPAPLVNTLVVIYFGLIGKSGKSGMYDFLRSRHSTATGRLVARKLGFYKGFISR